MGEWEVSLFLISVVDQIFLQLCLLRWDRRTETCQTHFVMTLDHQLFINHPRAPFAPGGKKEIMVNLMNQTEAGSKKKHLSDVGGEEFL